MDWLENLWLADYKIPVGKAAKFIFDGMKDHGKPLFDFMSWVMENLIAGILWLLDTPHPLVIVALAVALTWYLQRNWKICLLVLLGFLFILNQGYWKPTMESLTLILASCVVCMGLGVPIGIAAAHRPRLFRAMQPILDLMQQAFRGAYGSAPSVLQFSKWVRNFRQFGLLLSTPWVAKHSQKTRTDALRERYFVNTEFDTREFYAAAERRLGKLTTLSYEYFVSGDFSKSAQASYLSQVGIDDLAEPTPVDLPNIPYLPPVRGKVTQPKQPKPPRIRLPQMGLRRKKSTVVTAPM